MSRFLITVWSLESHVNPNLAVAVALREAGHEVAFYAGPKATAAIAECGFRVFPFQALREEEASVQFAALLEDQGSARKLSQHFLDLLVTQLVPQVDDLNAIIDSWQPSALITDMAMIAPFAILMELRKIPVAVLSHVGYCMVPGPQGPVPGRALPPRNSALSKFRAWAIEGVANFMTRDVPKAIDERRRIFGFSPTGLRVTQLHARANLLLIPSTPELDYRRSDLPASVRYIGSLAWPTPETAATEKSVVAVEEGGYYRRDPFLLRMAIAGLKDSPFVVKLSPGRERNISSLGTLPGNMAIKRDTPEAEVVVTTGNTESVLRALGRGIPLVVVPSLLDQKEMALRVQRFGAGEFIEDKDCSPTRLLEAVTSTAANSGYRTKAMEAASLLHTHQGSRGAVRELEKLTR